MLQTTGPNHNHSTYWYSLHIECYRKNFFPEPQEQVGTIYDIWSEPRHRHTTHCSLVDTIVLNLHISSFYSSTRCQRTIPRCEGLATPKMGKRRGLLSPIPDDVKNSRGWVSSFGPVSRQIG